MLNLNTRLNGFSQTLDSAHQHNDKKCLSSINRIDNYIHIDEKNKFCSKFRESIINKKELLASPKPTSSKEDIYTFNDAEHSYIDNDISSSNVKRFVEPKISEINSIKKTLPSGLMKSDKGIDIFKTTNGLNNCNLVLQNGIKNRYNQEEMGKFIQNRLSPSKILLKQSKDQLKPSSLVFNSKELNNGLSKKNSIIKSSAKPVIVKSKSIYSNKKSVECLVKRESSNQKSEGTCSLLKKSIKLSPRNLLSGECSFTSLKGSQGRGPAIHEALQRIPSTATLNRIKPIVKKENCAKKKWHSPDSSLFDCSTLDSYSHGIESDSDSSDDSSFDYLTDLPEWFDDSFKTENRMKRMKLSKSSLRQRISQIQQSEYIIRSKPTFSLYHAVKMQMKQQKIGTTFRLEGKVLDKLLAKGNLKSFHISSNKRLIRQRKRSLKSVTTCSHLGCENPSSHESTLCDIHDINVARDQALRFKSSDKQCQGLLSNVKVEIPSTSSKHKKKNEHISNNFQDSNVKISSLKSFETENLSKINSKMKSSLSAEGFHCGTVASLSHADDTVGLSAYPSSSTYETTEDPALGGFNEGLIGSPNQQIVDSKIIAEILAMHESEDPAQDDNVDLTTVLTDFFTEQSEEYIPTHEETEELERALEAVNQDVKSLEKLTSTQQSSLLLENLLDEKVLAESLTSLPDTFNSVPAVKEPTSSLTS